jgi:hypothetical protein
MPEDPREREPLWWYERGSAEWERLVSEATDDTDWDALEANARSEHYYWATFTPPGARMPLRIGPRTLDYIFDAMSYAGVPVRTDMDQS